MMGQRLAAKEMNERAVVVMGTIYTYIYIYNMYIVRWAIVIKLIGNIEVTTNDTHVYQCSLMA